MNHDNELSPDEQVALDALAQLPPIEPAADIRERFRERAATERAIGPAPRRWIIVALAAMLAIAVGAGWWVDRQREERDAAQLRTALVAALSDLSAARRLGAINSAGNARPGDQAMIAALTHALLADPSVNVRVASADALGRIADPNALRDAVTRAARRETSPFVQAALLTAAERLPRTDRARVIAVLLSRDDLDPLVRAEARDLVHS